MRLMASDAFRQSLPLEMAPVFGDLGMTGQAIRETQQRAAVGLVASGAAELHGCLSGKRFSLERHATVATYARFARGFEPVGLGDELMAHGAVKRLHAADIRRSLRVTSHAFFGRGLHGVQRRQMT